MPSRRCAARNILPGKPLRDRVGCQTEGMTTRSVDWPHYHLWTDALHARQLARDAANEWDRGAYVRWAVNSAWTAFETACESLVGPGAHLGNRFKKKLDEALDRCGFARPNWGSGLWQDVMKVYGQRKSFTHDVQDQSTLFPDRSVADDAIRLLRLATKDMYARAGKADPKWVEDDEDIYDPSRPGGLSGHAIGTVTTAGGDAPDAVRIAIVLAVDGKEHVVRAEPPGTDPEPLIEQILAGMNMPVLAVRVYQGDELIKEDSVNMRGAPL